MVGDQGGPPLFYVPETDYLRSMSLISTTGPHWQMLTASFLIWPVTRTGNPSVRKPWGSDSSGT